MWKWYIFFLLLTFVIDWLIRWAYDQKGKRKSIEAKLNTIKSWVNLLDEPMRTKKEKIETFCKELKETKSIHPIKFNHNMLLVGRLKEIEIEDYVNILVTNMKGDYERKSKNLFNIIHQQEYLSVTEKEILDKYEEYNRENTRLMNEWNSHFSEIMDIIGDLERETANDATHSGQEFFRKVKDLLSHLPKTDDIESTVLYEKLLEPLEGWCLEEIKKNPSHNFSTKINKRVFQMKLIYKQGMFNNKKYSELFDEIKDKLLTSYDKMKEAKDEVETRDIKPWYNLT
jgi:hypothetical protein